MQKKILYVAATAVVLATSGCIDKAMQQAKDWCGGACKANAESAADRTEKGEEAPDAKGERKSVSAEFVKNALETNDKIMVINVLAKKYFDDCHIVGSVNMPLETIAQDIAKVKHDTKIVLYCANPSCAASHKAADRLEQLGYTNVHLYEGGMQEWVDLGYPYDGPAEAEYFKKGK